MAVILQALAPLITQSALYQCMPIQADGQGTKITHAFASASWAAKNISAFFYRIDSRRAGEPTCPPI
jgi:hypothetical protein